MEQNDRKTKTENEKQDNTDLDNVLSDIETNKMSGGDEIRRKKTEDDQSKRKKKSFDNDTDNDDLSEEEIFKEEIAAHQQENNKEISQNGSDHPRNIFIKHLKYLSTNNIALPFLVSIHPEDDLFSSVRTISVSACELDQKNIHFYMRTPINCTLHELKTTFEGEITNISLTGRIFKLTLRSQKGSQSIVLTDSMYESVLNEDLMTGDIVHVEIKAEAIKKLGRCDSKFEYDIEKGKKLPLPKDDVEKTRYISHSVNLHEMDMGHRSDIPCFGPEETDSKNIGFLNSCGKSDDLLLKYLDKGLGEMETGILLIKDTHFIDLMILQRIINTVESSRFSPIVLFCTENREFIKENKEIFENILYVEFYNSKNTDKESELTTQFVLEEKLKQLDQEIAEELRNIANEKGEEFALGMIELVKTLEKDDLKEIVGELVL